MYKKALANCYNEGIISKTKKTEDAALQAFKAILRILCFTLLYSLFNAAPER